MWWSTAGNSQHFPTLQGLHTHRSTSVPNTHWGKTDIKFSFDFVKYKNLAFLFLNVAFVFIFSHLKLQFEPHANSVHPLSPALYMPLHVPSTSVLPLFSAVSLLSWEKNYTHGHYGWCVVDPVLSCPENKDTLWWMTSICHLQNLKMQSKGWYGQVWVPASVQYSTMVEDLWISEFSEHLTLIQTVLRRGQHVSCVQNQVLGKSSKLEDFVFSTIM